MTRANKQDQRAAGLFRREIMSDEQSAELESSERSSDPNNLENGGGENAGAETPTALSEDAVREELKKVIDPELFVNIVDLGLIYVIDFEPAQDERQNVKIDMTMTSPACPAGPQLIAQSKMVVKQMAGVDDVEVRIVMDPPWSPEKMTEDARDQLGIF